jgi:hypothetical protein
MKEIRITHGLKEELYRKLKYMAIEEETTLRALIDEALDAVYMQDNRKYIVRKSPKNP